MKGNTEHTGNTPETSINIHRLWHVMLTHWWWFAISFVVIMSGAVFYLKTTNTAATTYASVMFNQNEDDSPGTSGTLSSLMSTFSLGNSSVNIEDEIYRMQSHSAIKSIVSTLDLNKDYTSRSSIFRPKTIYFQNSPITIETPPGMLDTISYSTIFTLKISEQGRKLHLKVKQGTYKTVFNSTIPQLPYTVKTPLGNFTITTTSFYHPEHDMTFKAIVENIDVSAIEWFRDIDVYLKIKKSNVVEIKIDDRNPKRARAIANLLIKLYNDRSMSTRGAQSRATLDFLNNRLSMLYNELEQSGSGIAAYKERHNLTDPTAEAEFIMKAKSEANSGLIEQETQLGILNMLRDFLTNSGNKYSLIPITAVAGKESEGTNMSIASYNDMVLELMRMQSSAKGNNATMRQLESQIEAMRANMIASLDRSISAYKIGISRVNREQDTVDSRISAIPRMEQELTNLMRDNEVKNRIYAYLLQKREEAEVKVARIMPTGVVIDEAWTDADSLRPQKSIVLAVAALAALFIPTILLTTLYRREFMTGEPSRIRREEEEIKQEID